MPIQSVIAQLSNNPAVPISLKQMMTFGENMTEDKLLQAGNFVSLSQLLEHFGDVIAILTEYMPSLLSCAYNMNTNRSDKNFQYE